MQVKPRQKSPLTLKFSFDSQEIGFVNSCSLLGVEIDSEFSWRDHVEKVSGKLSRFTYALYELKKCTDLRTAMTAYYAYAHAWLSYGVILWGNSTYCNKLFVLQKKCIRILVNIKERDSCRPHFTSLKILTFTSIYILEISKFVKKHKNLFGQERDNCCRAGLRKRNQLVGSFTNLRIVRSGIYHMAIKIYNKIPFEIRNITKVNIFAKKLKEYLLSRCFYNLQEFFDSEE